MVNGQKLAPLTKTWRCLNAVEEQVCVRPMNYHYLIEFGTQISTNVADVPTRLKLNSDCEMGYFGDGLGMFWRWVFSRSEIWNCIQTSLRVCHYPCQFPWEFPSVLAMVQKHIVKLLWDGRDVNSSQYPCALSKSPVNLKAMTQAFKFGTRSTSINRAPVLEIAWTQALYTYLRIKSNQSSNDPPSQTSKKKAHKNGRLHNFCFPARRGKLQRHLGENSETTNIQLTYPTFGKGKSSSKVPWDGIY